MSRRKGSLDHNRALDMWLDGVPTEEIARVIGAESGNSVLHIISRARKVNDPRAVVRKNVASTKVRDAVTTSIKNFNKRRRAKKFMATDADLSAAIAAYRGPVTKLPPGVHCGWRPRWS